MGENIHQASKVTNLECLEIISELINALKPVSGGNVASPDELSIKLINFKAFKVCENLKLN